MKAYKRPNQAADGFTIIETLMVLAIAGMIMLFVFEAIPALQRASRNSQRKQDITTILQALSQDELNKSGNFPACSGNACWSAAGDPLYTAHQKGQLHLYDPAQGAIISMNDQALDSLANKGPVTNTDVVAIYNYQKCDDTNLGKGTISGAGYNDVVALYALESGGGYTSQCQQL